MDVVDWLLDSDPAIRWQVMRDLTDADPAEAAAERSRVAREALGADLLARQGPDGAWHKRDEPDWVPTLYTVLLLRATGVDYAEAPRLVRRAVGWHGRSRTGRRNPGRSRPSHPQP